MIKVIILILVGLIVCSACFLIGLFFASSRLNYREEVCLYHKHLYKVHCRFIQSKGFDKIITVFASNEYDAIGQVLKKRFKYNNIEYPVYSIISVYKLDNLEEDYYA